MVYFHRDIGAALPVAESASRPHCAPGAFGTFGHIFDSIFSADFRVHLGIYAQNRLKKNAPGAF